MASLKTNEGADMAILGKKICESVLAGIWEARELHAKTSRRRFIHAPEYWVTSMVAQRLAKDVPGCGVELEPSVRDVLDLAHASKPGRVPKWLRKAGRFDIVLWPPKSETPYAAIEVKHPVRQGTIPAVIKDVRRIAIALDQAAYAGLLELGCVGFYCTASKKVSEEGEKNAARIIDGVLAALEVEANKLKRVRGAGLLVDVEPSRGAAILDKASGETTYGKACVVMVRRSKKA